MPTTDFKKCLSSRSLCFIFLKRAFSEACSVKTLDAMSMYHADLKGEEELKAELQEQKTNISRLEVSPACAYKLPPIFLPALFHEKLPVAG